MKRKLLILAAILAVALMAAPALATPVTLSIPAGSTAGGQPVAASATFETSADTLTIAISNLEANPTSVIQNISDLFFSITTGQTLGSITSSSGLERTVNSDGTYSDGSAVATGWVLSNTAGVFHLDGLNGAADVPAHTIIGGPDGSNVYSNANASIAGNGPHNPFLFGPVDFTITIPGITDASTVSGVVFSFGTASGTNVNVPIPPTALLLGTGLLGLVGFSWRRKRG